MTTFPGAPRLLKGGLVHIDPGTGRVLRVVAFQYNPGSLTRSLQVRGTGENGDRSEALRLTGPPVETYQLEAEVDATDQLELPSENPTEVEHGVLPRLAALAAIAYPASDQLVANDRLAAAGTLEIVPVEAPLTLFVWSTKRVLPVRLTEVSMTEEGFDPELNPIRAKVSLTLRVLTVDDLGFEHRGGSLYLAHQQELERFAAQGSRSALGVLGLTGIP
jgi:hypothetical protein